MSAALARWHIPKAAEEIAARMLQRAGAEQTDNAQIENRSSEQARANKAPDPGHHMPLQSHASCR